MGDGPGGGHPASVLAAAPFTGRMPAGSGDVAVETHGIAPVPEGSRYGTARRLFTVWFAPNLIISNVFAGTLGIDFGLGFWLTLLAMVAGTVLGALPVAYLSTWGPRTGVGQLPLARIAFGGGVVLPGVVQWLSSIAWDGLVGLFGGEALATLLHIPFVLGVVIILALQCVVGVFGYELIHRVQKVMSVVLVVTFAVLTVKLVTGHPVVTGNTAHGGDLAGSFVLELTIALSLSISWASYASDYSRYLPASTPRRGVFWYTLGGVVLSYVAIQAIGAASAGALSDQTAEGVRRLMGGGALGVLALLAIAVAAVGSNAMNDYSGSLALQTVGIRVRRPVAAGVVTVLALALILWLHDGDLTGKFQNVLLFVGYWIPGFVAVVAIDWLARLRGRGPGGRATLDAVRESTTRAHAVAATVAFVVGFGVAMPFMDTYLFVGPVARAMHGADIAYFVGFLATAALYAPVRLRGRATVAQSGEAAPETEAPVRPPVADAS